MTPESLRRNPRLLLVEDDDDVRLTTELVLQAQGFDVTSADSGAAALELIAQAAPDIAVIDVAMPGMDGLRLTRLIRESFDFPVLLLTARDLPSDVVTGLEVGADDYVTKPFDIDILTARLKVLLRRRGQGDATAAADLESFGAVVVDRAARVVTVDATEVALSATEFRLLEYLLDNIGHVVSRTQILRAVWGDADWIDERVVDTNVGRLRSKLSTDAIQTVRGFGYKVVRP